MTSSLLSCVAERVRRLKPCMANNKKDKSFILDQQSVLWHLCCCHFFYSDEKFACFIDHIDNVEVKLKGSIESAF